MKTIIINTTQHRENVLNAVAQMYNTWCVEVLKMKAIYETMNLCSVDVTQKCLIAECWTPKVDLEPLSKALEKGAEMSGLNIPPVMNVLEPLTTPPTCFKTNKFTKGFQNIVDAYGIATYREINPGPWTIITFPFLFGVMFGDAGHGLIMFLAALALVVLEKQIIEAKIKDEIFNIFFTGRYVILLMGLFSLYCGLLYNEVYSKSISIFRSSWKNPYTWNSIMNLSDSYVLQLPPEQAFDKQVGPYPFGFDPVWADAENKLLFENALKMKSSVIVGILQMFFGLMISICNFIYFKSVVDILFVWIPELLFLSCIFVYLCVTIIMKWIVIYVEPSVIFGFFYPSSNCAPSLLVGLINMFMVKGRDIGFVNTTSPGCTEAIDGGNYKEAVELCAPWHDCGLQTWYPNQAKVELILLVIAVISIPVMLFVKPLILWFYVKKGRPLKQIGHDDDTGEFSIGDTLVYQGIHTIEFCLGCISHTASYLRLWALSLAHSELSDVLWTMVLHNAFTAKGWVGMPIQWILFWAFALLTIAILILMEGLSAFLHALRLHWVEFESKFFIGTGHPFIPFSFDAIMNADE